MDHDTTPSACYTYSPKSLICKQYLFFFQPELSIFCLKSDFLFCLSDLDNYLKYSFVREENLDSDILKGFSLAWFHHNNLALQAPNIFQTLRTILQLTIFFLVFMLTEFLASCISFIVLTQQPSAVLWHYRIFSHGVLITQNQEYCKNKNLLFSVNCNCSIILHLSNSQVNRPSVLQNAIHPIL